jgi:hypothetical protein
MIFTCGVTFNLGKKPMKNKLVTAVSALSLSVIFASSQAFASCSCTFVAPPAPPPPVVHRFVGPCNSCNRDGALRHERCWQIPDQRDGRFVGWRRVCE